jgi:hypothetical protein
MTLRLYRLPLTMTRQSIEFHGRLYLLSGLQTKPFYLQTIEANLEYRLCSLVARTNTAQSFPRATLRHAEILTSYANGVKSIGPAAPLLRRHLRWHSHL